MREGQIFSSAEENIDINIYKYGQTIAEEYFNETKKICVDVGL
jgi:hypothetical protein